LIRVHISGTGSFLPNDPVPNDRLEELLGPLNDAPPRVQKFIATVGPQILARGGIESRHFAIDPKTRRLTHTVATMAEESARRAMSDAGKTPADVDFLVLSSPNYDQMTPPTSTILQELLGIESCAEMEIHSNCTGVGKSVQVAYDALRTGRYKTALVTYVQFSSVNLRSCYFNQEQITKTQAALRYILADASGSVFLEAVEGDGREHLPHEVVGTFVESIGGKRQPGMTAGGSVADLTEDGDPITSIYGRGTHHLSQDFTAVNRDAGPLLCDGVARMLSSLDVDPKTVPHYIYSIPTRQLYEENTKRFVEQLGITPEQVKFRAQRTGYCGGASLLLHLDEMARSGELQPGQLVVLHSVESSKWMSAGFVVRW
jgi:3-oxoacyl-[acyl-carrier-protein] synthase-3